MEASNVIIVGTGPSVEGVDHNALKNANARVITVNGALEWLPVVHHFFSLDPSVYVRGLLTPRRPGVVYHMAVPDDYGESTARIKGHRTPRERDVHFYKRVTGDGPFKSCPTLSTVPGEIHTGNSVYGALGLAYHMRARRVVLLGLDCTTDRYAYSDGGPRDQFGHVPELFASTIPQLKARGISVMNGSLNSLVDCFPRTTGGEALKWLDW